MKNQEPVFSPQWLVYDGQQRAFVDSLRAQTFIERPKPIHPNCKTEIMPNLTEINSNSLVRTVVADEIEDIKMVLNARKNSKNKKDYEFLVIADALLEILIKLDPKMEIELHEEWCWEDIDVLKKQAKK